MNARFLLPMKYTKEKKTVFDLENVQNFSFINYILMDFFSELHLFFHVLPNLMKRSNEDDLLLMKIKFAFANLKDRSFSLVKINKHMFNGIKLNIYIDY